MRSRLEVVFGAFAGDLLNPTFTSLRVLDANGALSERVSVGEAATLHFSTTGAASRVWFRKYGTLDWRLRREKATHSEALARSTLG